MPDPREVRSMFARISGRYDLLNHVLSAGIDRSWRRAAVAAGERGLEGSVRGARVVDVCCGTGDLSLAFAGAGARVLGLDFTPEMVRLAEPKWRAGASHRGPGGQARFAVGDALRLPLAPGACDLASVAFGVRNLADPDAGLRELARVVRPGGVVLVLEFSPPPTGLVGTAYRAYFQRLLPLVGGLVSGDREAYRYLPRTVTAWPGPREVLGKLEAAGLRDCGFESLSMGIASLHWGRVPNGRGIPLPSLETAEGGRSR